MKFSCLSCVLILIAALPLVAGQRAKNASKTDPASPSARGAESRNSGSKVGPKVDDPALATAPYIIGEGDILSIDVWREPEVSQKLAVRPDGMISLSLIGDVRASGLTTEELGTQIQQKLKAFLTDPRVAVILVEVRSKWFSIVGQVSKPGRYPILRPMTVLEALSTAGGFQEFAKPSKIYVLHQVNGNTVRLPFHYNDVLKGKRLNENIGVNDGDTIVVP